jgi:pimeloyl-ACP methyl ester carboxylesterase
MPLVEQGEVRIRYEVSGNPDRYPLLLLALGGPNSAIAMWPRAPFNPMEVFKDDFRIIAMDQRNALNGESTGPVPTSHTWDSFLSDQLAVLDHAGVRETLVLGFCIGCSFILGLMQKAPERITAGVLCQPIGHRPEDPDVMWDATLEWGKELSAKRPNVDMATVEAFATDMYRSPADFVYSVDRDFVRSCRNPILVLPGIDRAHPYDVGVQVADLAPSSERIDPWREPAELIPQTVEGIRAYLLKHTPAVTR